MPLQPGTRLGPYVIEGTLGAGGMGEVYKARDPRLDRIVAIKTLASHLTSDPDRHQRFDREARAVASLSHPNICAIFDVGHDADLTYLVMEYLDGETLAERLASTGRPSTHHSASAGGSDGDAHVPANPRRPLPIGETLGIGVQLARALAAAHRAGIVHRDLKPANIVLLRSGATHHGAPQVKVLDFGLARLAGSTPDTEPLMTTEAPLTAVGMLVGTVPYMSPEQVEGRIADARSDIFSLGSVLYEMASGRRAFDAGSQAGVIAAILERQPEPIAQLQPMTPPGLDRVVSTCLAKSPDERWQHAGDIARQLEWLASELQSGARGVPSTTSSVTPIDEVRHRKRSIGWAPVVATIAGVALAGDLGWRIFRTASRLPAAAEPIAAHMPLSVPGVSIVALDVSPDGRTVAIEGTRSDGRSGNWLYRLADGRLEELPNLDPSAQLVGWSRDGTELAFRSARTLVALRLDGRLVRPLAPTGDSSRTPGTWGGDEFLVGSNADGLRALATGTGAVRQLTTGLALRPRFLPDGRRFLYTSKQAPDTPGNPDGLYLSSLDAPSDRRLILPKRSSGLYADGHLLFVEDGTLFAQPFDLSRAELSGTAMPVLDGVRYFHPNGGAEFRVGGGTIAYATPFPDDSPVWIDRRGAVTGKLGDPGLYREARLSPDGLRVVYARDDRRQSTGDLWLQDLARHTTVRLTNDEWSEANLLWSLDGRRIAYWKDRDGPPDIYEQDTEAGTPPRKLYATPAADAAIGWLPGERLLVRSDTRLVVVRSDGSIDESMKDLPPGGGEIAVSPDGQWLARTGREGGASQVYVQPLGRPGLRVTLGQGGGAKPVWSRDGRWLYFTSDRQLLQCAVRTGATFSNDPPTVLFTLDREIRRFDVSPDGQRFLVNRAPSSDFTPFRLLVNWRAKLAAGLKGGS